jgi:stage III sporulation protein AH
VKKLLRKNQVIITALVVMVAMAGYLSMTDKDELSMTASNDSVTDAEVADISDEDIVLDGDDSATGVSVSAVDAASDDVATKDNAGEAVLVSNMVNSSYFEEAKLSREQTRAKNKETLTELVNNENATSAQKEKAMEEIMNMTNVSEMETATENLLAAKGFDESIVTILDDSVDVVVNGEELTEQQIVQIADIVKRKTSVSADKIVISTVGKNK